MFGLWFVGFQFILLCVVAGFFFSLGQHLQGRAWAWVDQMWWDRVTRPRLRAMYRSEDTEIEEVENQPQAGSRPSRSEIGEVEECSTSSTVASSE